jgi:glycosyltransferase 2 family protein
VSPSVRSSRRRVAGLLFGAAVIAFLALFVARNIDQLREHEWSIRPGILALAVVVNIAGLAWGVAVWRLVLRRMQVQVGYLQLARVWFISGLGRYIPGKIWQFVGAAQLGQGAGLPVGATVTSLAVHTLFFIYGALLTALYLVPTSTNEVADAIVPALRWAGVLLLLLAHPTILRSALRLVGRIAPGATLDWTGNWLEGIGLIALSVVGWVLTGAAFFLFVMALTPLPLSAFGALIGINALAFVAGYLVFVAPAGLGVRELSLTVLLSAFVPTEVAALIAVAARLWTVLSEVIPAAVLLVLPRPTAPSNSPSGAAAPGLDT